MFESIELTFFRKVVLLVACVLLPGFVYGVLLFLGNDRPKFDVSHQVTRVVFLQDLNGPANAFFLNRPGQFDQCVRERGRELCLRLLSEQIAGSLAGQPRSVPGAAETAGESAHNTDQGDPDFLAQARLLAAGFMGIAIALCCTLVGADMGKRISAG